jgi:HNH endonuclease
MPFFYDPEGSFWSKVDRSGGEDECWIWTRAVYGNNGYGALKVNGKKVAAHRYSYELHYGIVPKDKDVCHRCNNRLCVNPRHLYLGTAKDNVSDAIKSGTHHFAPGASLQGIDNPSARLTESEVLEIYYRVWSGEPGIRLAAEYGVSEQEVSRIKNGQTWAWLTGHEQEL